MAGDKPRPDFSDVHERRIVDGAEAPAPPAPHLQIYTVVAGDSLSKIAKRVYGDANQWRRIFEANRDQIENPDLIQPGRS